MTTTIPHVSLRELIDALDDETCERVAAELEDEDFADKVYGYIYGVRRPRQNPVTCRQIDEHFHEYSRIAVSAALDSLILAGRVRVMMRSLSSRRRANGAYCYEAVPTKPDYQ